MWYYYTHVVLRNLNAFSFNCMAISYSIKRETERERERERENIDFFLNKVFRVLRKNLKLLEISKLKLIRDIRLLI